MNQKYVEVIPAYHTAETTVREHPTGFGSPTWLPLVHPFLICYTFPFSIPPLLISQTSLSFFIILLLFHAPYDQDFFLFLCSVEISPRLRWQLRRLVLPFAPLLSLTITDSSTPVTSYPNVQSYYGEPNVNYRRKWATKFMVLRDLERKGSLWDTQTAGKALMTKKKHFTGP